MPVTLVCKICGNNYSVRPSEAQKSKYCSRACANKAKETGHDVKCAYCGKIIHRRQYWIDRQANKNQNNFCSTQCEHQYKSVHSKEVRYCQQCGEKFETSKKSTKRFCSPSCSNKWQTTLIGEENSHYKKVTTECSYCGNKIKLKPSHMSRTDKHFCNRKCQGLWYSEVFSKTPEYKEWSRKRACESVQSMKTTNTKPQQIINNLLNQMNISFVNEYPFDYYCADIYLPDNKLIIEVMGDYWHGNPCIYTLEKLNDSQKYNIKRDYQKLNYITSHYDSKILYLWESDIYNNLDVCSVLVSEYIKQNGFLSDYNSYNYKLINEQLTLNKEKIDKPIQILKNA